MPRAKSWNSDVSPYFFGSLLAHLIVAFVFIKVIGGFSSSTPPIYTIDFIGPSAVTIEGAAPTIPEQKNSPALQSPTIKKDSFPSHKNHKHFTLPKPSLLSSDAAPKKATAKADAAQTIKTQSHFHSSAPTGSANISADLPNFPYPWYISELRAQLWSQWSKRLATVSGESVVVFEIMPNGQVVDLKTQSSSGDAGFDLAALSAVQDASPFPPLPKGFNQPFLKIHLTLTSR